MKKIKYIFLVFAAVAMLLQSCEETFEEEISSNINPPGAPSGLVITNSCGQIELTWDSIYLASTYEIFLGDQLIVDGLIKPEYVYIPDNLELAEYRIIARNQYGATVEATTGTGQKLGPPTTVTGFAASDEEYSTKIVLTWDTENTASGYRVIVDGAVIADVADPEYTDFDVTIYSKTYSVIAYNSCGDAASAATDAGIITQAPPPVTPANFTATTDDVFGVVLSWDAVDNVQYYKILLDGQIVADKITETSYVDINGPTTLQEYSLVAYSPFGAASATTAMGGKPDNLIVNGDFEAAVWAWNAWGNGGAGVGSDVTDIFRGDYCGRIAANKGSFMQKNIKLEIGKVYVFKYTYKWAVGAIGTTVASYTPTGSPLVKWNLLPVTVWTTEEKELTATSDNYKFNFFKSDGTSAILFMDDIRVYEKLVVK